MMANSTQHYSRQATYAPQSLQPATSHNTIRPHANRQRGKAGVKKTITHFKNPIRFESVHTKPTILSAPHDLTPIAHQPCARPHRPIRPEYASNLPNDRPER